MIQRLLCFFGKHRVDRRHVQHDGRDFFGPCSGCGARMNRSSDRGIWETTKEHRDTEEAG